MKTLNVNVSDKVASYRQRDGVIVCGNSDYQIKFVFDSDWDDNPKKTARFIWNGQYVDVDFEGDVCRVPIIHNTTAVSIGVYSGELSTTTPAVIECKKSILCPDVEASAEMRKEYADAAELSAKRAEEAAERAEAIGGVAEVETIKYTDSDGLVTIPKGAKRVTVTGTCSGYMSGGNVYFVLVDSNRNIISNTRIGMDHDTDVFDVFAQLDIPDNASHIGTAISTEDFSEVECGYTCSLNVEFAISVRGDDGFSPTIDVIEQKKTLTYKQTNGLMAIPTGATSVTVRGTCSGYKSSGPVYFVLVDGNRNIISTALIGTGSDTNVLDVFAELEIPDDAVCFGSYPFDNGIYNVSINEGYSCDLTAEFSCLWQDGVILSITDVNGNKTVRIPDGMATKTNKNFANALKGTTRGNAVKLTDISPVTHTFDVKVKSKNLLPFPYNEMGKEMNGITFTANADGSVTINGTATEGAYMVLSLDLYLGDTNLSGSVPSVSTNGTYVLSELVYYHAASKGTSISINKGATYNNYTVYPQVEIGTKPTEYTPHVPDISTVKVKAQGKNLLPYPYILSTKEMNGITFTTNDDRSVTINGTCTGDTSYYGLYMGLDLGDKELTGSHPTQKTNGTYVLGEKLHYQADNRMVMILVKNGEVYNNYRYYPQVEYGTEPTEYEPYIEPIEYAVNADGSVDGVVSIYPTTSLTTDNKGAVIEVSYNKDANKVVASLEERIAALEAMIISQ